MPWALFETYEQLPENKKEILKEIHERKYHLDMEIVLTELQIRTEFLRRDFTKRQMNILTFIYNYTFGFAKEWALIPKIRDWEIAGISAGKVRNELTQLVSMGVIDWNEEENLFRIKEPLHWKNVPYNSGFNHDRSKELRVINVIHAGINIK